MKKGYTHIVVVLDRSGSMSSVREDTIGGFNTFLNDQKANEGEATLTFVQFNTSHQTLYFTEPLNDIPELTLSNYVPAGGTALLDAIGKTVTLTGEQLADLSDDERPEKVIVVILTDGEENSSSTFKNDQVRDLIKHQEEVYDWTFMFIGANIDSFAASHALGFSASNTINFVQSSVGTTEAFKSMSKGLTSYRRSSGADYEALKTRGLFDADDYAAQNSLGADNSKRGTI